MMRAVQAVSAPIKDFRDEVKYCISVNGPTVRIQVDEKAMVTLVIKAADSISRLYGARIPEV